MLPSLSLPPLEICFGTSPIHAEKSRPDRNALGSAMLATRAVASAGPTPGIASSCLLVARCHRSVEPEGSHEANPCTQVRRFKVLLLAPWLHLESVRRLHAGLQSFLSMRRIEARRKNASAFRLRFSQSLVSLRQRLSHAIVRSTIQRLGNTTNPLI